MVNATPMRGLLALFVFLAVAPLLQAGSHPAWADAATPSPAPAAGAPAVPSAVPGAPALAPAEARRLLDLLTDDKQRAAFVADLRLLAKAAGPASPAADPTQAAAKPAPTAAATPPPAKPAPVAPAEIQIAPDSVGAQVLVGVANFLKAGTGEAMATLGALRNLPSIGAWLTDFASDRYMQDRLVRTVWRLLAVLAIGLLAEWLLRRALARPLAALRHNEGAGPPPADHPAEAAAAAIDGPAHRVRFAVLHRVPLALGQLLLELAPVLGFLMIAHLAIGSALGSSRNIRLVLLAMVDAYGACRGLMCVVRLFVSPRAPGLRLLPVSDPGALYAERWARRLIALACFGYAVGVAGLLFGVSDTGHDIYMKSVALVGHVMIGVIILQIRRPVSRWLKPRADARGVVALIRRRFAVSWHWIALFYDAALWLIWAVEIPDGYARLWRIFFGTMLVLAIARTAAMGILNGLDAALRVKPGVEKRYPGLQDRLQFYQPALRAATFVTVGLFTVFALLQSWGLGALTWLLSEPLGHRVLSALVSLGITLLAALAAWEGLNFAFNRELDRLSRQAQLARLGRLRTLLPMLRTALLITIVIVVGLMVLSEIGVNIAPLLAGAGVLGIAIGFGSQKLVQDVITGLFLLLENTMQVGDVVALGGLSGVVENLSIRTIRLRAEDGSVHVIPFSAVTTVTNQTRDFSHAVIDVAIGYRDDYDRAVQVMTDLVQEMRREPRWMGEIRDDLEVWGLDKFSDSGVMIKCRIRCGPFGRWSVGREFNRRLRLGFEQAGIYLARQGWADDPALMPAATPPPAAPAALDAPAAAAGAAMGAAMMDAAAQQRPG
jgi:small-conductance mechanosensitive channel